MKVETILKAKGYKVVTTRPNASIAEVLYQLQGDDIGAVVVCDDERQVLGIISERDIVRRLLQYGSELMDRQAHEIMSRPIITCSPGDSIRYVMAQMTQRHIRHLPVINDHGRMCGMISIGDVVKNRLDELETEAAVLRDRFGTVPEGAREEV